MENVPLQVRAGYNMGERATSLTGVRFLGQPAIKVGAGDTVLIQNSPQVPGKGQSSPRSQNINLLAVGYLINRTGGPIGYDYILKDPQGNEFRFFAADIGLSPLADGEQQMIMSLGLAAFRSTAGHLPLSVLLPGWSLVLRVLSGNPTTGKGLIAWVWTQDLGNNMQTLMVPLSSTEVEIGPGKGRAWQLCGSKTSTSVGLGGPVYVNFDDIERTIVDEIYNLAGEDIKVNNVRDVDVTVRTDEDGGFNRGFLMEVGEVKKGKGLVLAYPDKMKVRAGENQHKAPLYMLVNFAEFDLPADME